MLVDLKASARRRDQLAQLLKARFDDIQEADSGWRYVDFDHPAFGREEASHIADRIPGNILVSTDPPGDGADVLIVLAGYPDPFTGDVRLANESTVLAQEAFDLDRPRQDGEDDDDGPYPNRLLPAVALFGEGDRLFALIGAVHETREACFETGWLRPMLAESIAGMTRDLLHHHPERWPDGV